MNKSAYWIIGIAAALIVGTGVLWYVQENPIGSGDTHLDAFAQCLAAKGITMYGAEWCPHCKNEKKRFGASWQYVPYVECPDNPKLCLDKGVDGYPTWILGDGTKLEGEQGLENLSRASACPLPTESPTPSN